MFRHKQRSTTPAKGATSLRCLPQISNINKPGTRVKEEKDMKEEEEGFIKQMIRLCPEIDKAREQGRRFRKMIRQREVDELERWMKAATTSQIREIEGFAEGLKKDLEAVRGALEYEWSKGQVEGQVNRLKLIKRQMYGRAKFDLLRARVLQSG
ncbi:MAG TPA: transposase [Blastocatellia bacterium]|nr:transposase [Blastocatellia bacterium]